MLTVCDMQQAMNTAMKFVGQDEGMDLVDLTPDNLAKPIEYLLWPMEHLLVRQVSFDLPHIKLIDQDILGNEIEEACDEDASQWWLSSVLAKRTESVTGVLFGLAMSTREALSNHQVWQECDYVLPDAWVRLSVLIPSGLENTQAVVSEDESGICVGMFDEHGCFALRRINKTTWRSEAMMAEEVRRSLYAMQVTDDCTILGQCGPVLQTHLSDVFTNCQIQEITLLSREEANVLALMDYLLEKQQQLQLANLRHGGWATQKRIQIDWKHWRVSLILVMVAFMVLLAGQGLQVHQLKIHTHQLEQAIEMTFRAALPDRPKNYEPLAQLRKAVGEVSDVDSWYLLKQLQAISTLKKQIPDMTVKKIQFKKGNMLLYAQVKNFAAVNRVQDVLTGILKVDVQVEDTELDSQRTVLFRLKWS